MAYMYADSKVEGRVSGEQLALYDRLRQPHTALTDAVNRHKASKEEAPAPGFQRVYPLQSAKLTVRLLAAQHHGRDLSHNCPAAVQPMHQVQTSVLVCDICNAT